MKKLHKLPKRKTNFLIYEQIANLKVGEILQFSQKEWFGTSNPRNAIFSRISKANKNPISWTASMKYSINSRLSGGRKFSIRKEKNNWVVIRIK